ncbi:hypothetical protein [Dryocola sp. BD626]|uniref:hypothetical protein n=1 Tax=Dryocola sp. BD626 TaxID=3133273 RepID=UPI003F505EA1
MHTYGFIKHHGLLFTVPVLSSLQGRLRYLSFYWQALLWQRWVVRRKKIKSVGVLQVRQVIKELLGENNRRSNATSVGSIAIQLGVAAQTLGMNPHALTPFQQFRLSRCLLDSRFNIRVVAFHLRDLILFDNPGINTRILTEEQIILAGSRYNRGTQRNASDILKSITAPKGTLSRQYSEYGRRIMEKKQTILQILEGR